MYEITESKIENTIFEVRKNENGEILSYRIRPVPGYKLHEITLDEAVIDVDGIETGEKKKGFTEAYVTAGACYDFDKNERELYAEEVGSSEDVS